MQKRKQYVLIELSEDAPLAKVEMIKQALPKLITFAVNAFHVEEDGFDGLQAYTGKPMSSLGRQPRGVVGDPFPPITKEEREAQRDPLKWHALYGNNPTPVVKEEPTAQDLYRRSTDPATGERIYTRISASEESQIGRLEWLSVLTHDEAKDFAEERLQSEQGRTFYEERFRNAVERLGKELYFARETKPTKEWILDQAESMLRNIQVFEVSLINIYAGTDGKGNSKKKSQVSLEARAPRRQCQEDTLFGAYRRALERDPVTVEQAEEQLQARMAMQAPPPCPKRFQTECNGDSEPCILPANHPGKCE